MGGNTQSRDSVAIVDNDPITLQVLQSLLAEHFGFEIAWSAQTGYEAITRCEEEPAPNVILVDMSLSDMQGTDVCRVIRSYNDVTALLAITSYPLTQFAAKAADCGAQGIVDKTNIHRIATAIRILAIGQVLPLPPGCTGATFESAEICHDRIKKRHQNSEEIALSLREAQILELALRGYEQTEISDQLNITATTVRTHTRRAREKLHCRTLAQAIAAWLRLRQTRPYVLWNWKRILPHGKKSK